MTEGVHDTDRGTDNFEELIKNLVMERKLNQKNTQVRQTLVSSKEEIEAG